MVPGWVYDITNSYDLSFYLAGVFIAISGGVFVILPLTKATRRYNTRRKQATNDQPIEVTNDKTDVSNVQQMHVNGEVKQNGKFIM